MEASRGPSEHRFARFTGNPRLDAKTLACPPRPHTLTGIFGRDLLSLKHSTYHHTGGYVPTALSAEAPPTAAPTMTWSSGNTLLWRRPPTMRQRWLSGQRCSTDESHNTARGNLISRPPFWYNLSGTSIRLATIRDPITSNEWGSELAICVVSCREFVGGELQPALRFDMSRNTTRQTDRLRI